MSDKIEDIGLITEEIVDMLRAKTKAVADNLDSNYYDKGDIAALIHAGLNTTIVSSLPATGNESTIYLVPVDPTLQDTNNTYKEYIWVNINNVWKWEALGSTELNFNNYWDKDTVQSKLDEKIDKDNIPEIPTKLSDLTNDTHFFVLESVAQLPVTGENGKVYVVRAETTFDANNLYDEYIWLNGAWERLGYSDALKHSDLDNYYDNTQVYSAAEVESAINGLIGLLDENS